MKRKKSSSAQLPQITLSAEEMSAISHALDFMMHFKGFAYDESRFTHDDAFSAAEKADCGETAYKRREVRAISAAIELALQCMLNDDAALSQVAEAFPDLIPDLKESKPILESLRTRFAAYAAKLAQRK